MKKFIFLLILILPLFSYSQITGSGYFIYKWGGIKTTYPNLTHCNVTNAGDNFINCEIVSNDSIFLKSFHYDYCGMRFFNQKLSEIHFDLRYKELGSVIAKLSIDLGTPRILENAIHSADTAATTIGYEWIIGDTRVLIINKGPSNPVWCILSSQKIKKTYNKKVVDIEKLIFN